MWSPFGVSKVHPFPFKFITAFKIDRRYRYTGNTICGPEIVSVLAGDTQLRETLPQKPFEKRLGTLYSKHVSIVHLGRGIVRSLLP